MRVALACLPAVLPGSVKIQRGAPLTEPKRLVWQQLRPIVRLRPRESSGISCDGSFDLAIINRICTGVYIHYQTMSCVGKQLQILAWYRATLALTNYARFGIGAWCPARPPG